MYRRVRVLAATYSRGRIAPVLQHCRPRKFPKMVWAPEADEVDGIGTVPVGALTSAREEKRLTGWKQGHTPERRFGAPAVGGGFFLPRVIHRPSGPACSLEPRNASKALLLVLQGIKNPL